MGMAFCINSTSSDPVFGELISSYDLLPKLVDAGGINTMFTKVKVSICSLFFSFSRLWVHCMLISLALLCTMR